MTSNIAIDALRMAWFMRQPGKHAGVLFHSNRGNCWDAACSETLFGSLKVERLHGQRFVSPMHFEHNWLAAQARTASL